MTVWNIYETMKRVADERDVGAHHYCFQTGDPLHRKYHLGGIRSAGHAESIAQALGAELGPNWTVKTVSRQSTIAAPDFTRPPRLKQVRITGWNVEVFRP